MQSRTPNFTFDPTFNFGVDSLFSVKTENFTPTPPPVTGNFLLLDGTDFMLLDGTNFLLL